MTAVLPDLESIEHLDFKPRCECRGHDSDASAEWVAISICGCGHPCCTPCKDRLQVQWASIAARVDVVTAECLVCGVQSIIPTNESLIRFEPL